jgi:hypothetical protein
MDVTISAMATQKTDPDRRSMKGTILLKWWNEWTAAE